MMARRLTARRMSWRMKAVRWLARRAQSLTRRWRIAGAHHCWLLLALLTSFHRGGGNAAAAELVAPVMMSASPHCMAAVVRRREKQKRRRRVHRGGFLRDHKQQKSWSCPWLNGCLYGAVVNGIRRFRGQRNHQHHLHRQKHSSCCGDVKSCEDHPS